jgi:plastocyanin
MWQSNRGPRNLAGALGFAAGVAVALACGNPAGEGNGCAGTGAQFVINAQDNQTFTPQITTVTHGESVCWQNLGSIAHTVTATTVSPVDSSWSADSVNLQLNPGSLVLRTFSRAGYNYHYKCALHNETGEIDVR